MTLFHFIQFLNFLQARVRELKKSGHSSHATTMMLVGIPNVGKSALANSLHQIGRISAAGMKFSWAADPGIVWTSSYCYLSNYKEFLFVKFWRTAHLTEKGKLKHAVVSSQPGETKNISSLKVCYLSPDVVVGGEVVLLSWVYRLSC